MALEGRDVRQANVELLDVRIAEIHRDAERASKRVTGSGIMSLLSGVGSFGAIEIANATPDQRLSDGLTAAAIGLTIFTAFYLYDTVMSIVDERHHLANERAYTSLRQRWATRFRSDSPNLP